MVFEPFATTAAAQALVDLSHPPPYLEGTKLSAWGHSFVRCSYMPPESSFAARIARKLGMTLNLRGYDGYTAALLSLVLCDGARAPYGVVLIDACENNTGGVANKQAEFTKGLRSLIVAARAGVRLVPTDAAHVYTGAGWAAATGPGTVGATKDTTVLDEYVERTFTGTSINYEVIGHGSAAACTLYSTTYVLGGNVEVKIDGVVVETISTLDVAETYPQMVIARTIRGLTNASHTIRLTNKTSGAKLRFKGTSVERTDPPGVVVFKERLYGAAAGSANNTAVNDLIAPVVAEFPANVGIADPTTTTWTFALHAIEDLQHPNHRGMTVYRDAGIAAIRALEPDYRAGLNMLTQTRVPAGSVALNV